MTTPMERDSIHELLCAYVLGEVDATEGARVEAALADSAELRAERERLTGTIGLVRSAYASGERLSDEALAAVLRAAETRSPIRSRGGSGFGGNGFGGLGAGRAWYHSPALRAAAAVVAMLGGVLAILSYESDASSADTHTEAVAQVLLEEVRADSARPDALAAPAEVPALAADRAGALAALGEVERLAQIDGYIEQARIALDAREKDKAEAYLGIVLLNAPDNQEARGLYFQYQNLEGLDSVVLGDQWSTLDREVSELNSLLTTEVELTLFGRSTGDRFVDRAYDGGADPSIFAGRAQTDPMARRLERQEQVAESLAAATPPPAPAADPASALGSARERASADAGESVASAQSGSDDLLLGRAAGREVTRENADSYRGPGDSLPVGGKPATQPDGAAVSTLRTTGLAAEAEVRAKVAKQSAQPTTAMRAAPPASKKAEAGDKVAIAGGEVGGIPDSTVERRGRADNALVPIDAPGTAGAAGERTRGESAYGVFSDEGKRVDRLRLPDLVEAVDGDEEGVTRRRKALRAPLERQRLTPDQLGILVDSETGRILQDCRRRPHERPRDMFFRFWGDNAFSITSQDPFSTFSADVDTASYALARRYLNEGHMPEKAQVRTEEFVNYFDPDLDPPSEGTFAIHTELAPSLFGGSERRWMLRVGVRGKEVDASQRQPLALTFVVDTSGSMRENGRLELVKFAMRQLVAQLDARDSIGIVAFNRETRLVLPMTSVANRGLIESAIHPLTPGGSTNAEAGLRMGYELALGALDPNVHHRVVLLSDGVANVGQTDQDRINADVARHREQGVYLNTIGVGMNNHNDVFLEQLANKGDGICDYIDSPEAATRAIVDRFTSAFVPIASDVKIQVVFDPNQVYRYRLLGYENRAIADKDFRNDAVDAGEVGAGHQIVALYEIERTAAVADEPLATVNLRWKAPKAAGSDPREVDVTEIAREVHAGDALGAFDSASPGYRRSVLVAQFAEFLRRSVHARDDSYDALVQEIARLAPQLGDPDFDEFATLVTRAYGLNLPRGYFQRDLDGVIDEYRRYQYLRAQIEDLKSSLGDHELRELRQRNDDLERRIRDLIRADLERKNG